MPNKAATVKEHLIVLFIFAKTINAIYFYTPAYLFMSTNIYLIKHFEIIFYIHP